MGQVSRLPDTFLIFDLASLEAEKSLCKDKPCKIPGKWTYFRDPEVLSSTYWAAKFFRAWSIQLKKNIVTTCMYCMYVLQELASLLQSVWRQIQSYSLGHVWILGNTHSLKEMHHWLNRMNTLLSDGKVFPEEQIVLIHRCSKGQSCCFAINTLHSKYTFAGLG